MTNATTDIFGEIGHEFKNKLGIIGSILNDIKLGFEVDAESIEDALKAYNQLLFVSSLIGSLNFDKDSKNNKLLSFLSSLIENEDITKSSSIEMTLSYGDNTFTKIISSDFEAIKLLLEKLEMPKSSLDKILKLSLATVCNSLGTSYFHLIIKTENNNLEKIFKF